MQVPHAQVFRCIDVLSCGAILGKSSLSDAVVLFGRWNCVHCLVIISLLGLNRVYSLIHLLLDLLVEVQSQQPDVIICSFLTSTKSCNIMTCAVFKVGSIY